MAIDYTKALKDYGWDNLISTIKSDPTWQDANNSERGSSFSSVNIPGIGPVTLDANGRINALDLASEANYEKDRGAPVYNTIWDGANQETGAFNGNDPGTYQVSHGGISPETLGMLAAAIVTGGVASGWGAGAGVGTGAAEGGFTALPAGGMTATGTAAPWTTAASNVLGSGTFGTGVSDIGALMGTSGGALGLGTGMSGVTAADLASALQSGIPVDGMNQLPNEAEKLARQQTLADAGTDLLPTNLPTVDLSSGLKATDALKLANTLKNMVSSPGKGGSSSSGGGFSGVPNEIYNMNPGMIQLASTPQDQHQAQNPFVIGDYKQPDFGYDDESQLSKLAKALKGGSWQP